MVDATSIGDNGRKLRVLCLHGYEQDADIFRTKLKQYIAALQDSVEFVFVTAPNTLHPYDIDGMDNMARAEAEKAGKTLGRVFKGWYYLKSVDPEVTVGVDTSIAYLDGVLEKQGPFDGILGFSQGGLIAAVMCSVLEHRQSSDSIGHPPFRFAIICSGYMLKDAEWQHLYEKPLSTPSLHLYGVLDPMIRFSRSMKLQRVFVNPKSTCSDGAHFIPKSQESILTVSQFIGQFH